MRRRPGEVTAAIRAALTLKRSTLMNSLNPQRMAGRARATIAPLKASPVWVARLHAASHEIVPLLPETTPTRRNLK